LDIRSTEGVGTKFEVYFPITPEEISQIKSNKPVEAYRGSNESILIVDDIKEQRDIASNILRNLNYFVEAVSSGEKAVEYMKSNPASIRAFLSLSPKLLGFVG